MQISEAIQKLEDLLPAMTPRERGAVKALIEVLGNSTTDEPTVPAVLATVRSWDFEAHFEDEKDLFRVRQIIEHIETGR